MQERRVLGLDIGADLIKIVEFTERREQKNQKKFLITSYVQAIMDTTKPIYDIIREALNKNDIKTKETIVNLQGADVGIKFLNIKVKTEKNLKDVVKYELTKDSSLDIDNYYYDFTKLSELPVPTGEKELKFLVVLAKKQNVDHLFNTLDKADLSPLAIDSTPTALFNCFNFAKSANASTISDAMIVNLGMSETIAIIIQNNNLSFVRILPTKGGEIIDLIRKRFQIEKKQDVLNFTQNPKEQAIEFKDVIGVKIEELGRDIRNTLNFYEGQSEAIIKNVFITGGLATLYGAVDILKEQIVNKQVEIFDPLANIELELKDEQKTLLLANPSLVAVTIGLASRME
ncbi:MAG: pilus assembly protein PilM [Planctomycetes bacterium]|nr:pilus assembly protein PilM [Planctomycetota bacterium]